MVNDLLKATEPLGADHASRGKLRILHAEASPEVVRQCSAELDKRGWHPSVVQVDCREEFSRQLWTGAWDLVLASARLRGWNGCEAPEAVRRLRRDIPVILIDGAIGEETVAEALRRGAADYVSTRHLSRLPEVVSRVLRDRSERAEKRRLAEERDRFFMLSTDLLCIFNTRGEILQLNPAWHRSLGFDIEELVKQPLMEWIHPEDRPKFNEAVESLSKGAACTELESRVLSVDGSCRWLQWRASCIPRQPLIYATARDVTETRRLQGQLLQAQRIESIGTLANGIAHDLNNVLTPILMAVDILQEHAVDARALKLLSTVQSSARHGADMVRQILAFSRGMDGEKLPIQLKHLVNKMRDFARDTFPRSIEISSEVATDVCEVLGDATQLHQVLLNLCVNARDAMPGGGSLVLNLFERELEEPYLRLHPDARPGRYAVLSVTDTGTGIPQEIQDKIFEPFFTTKEPGKGTGLGLSSVIGIVKGHGGFLNVYSEPGKGTRFTVYFPAMREETPSTPLPAVPRTISMGQGETILVADDEAAFRDISRRILEKYGYKVVLASTGQEAIQLSRQKAGDIQLAIVDLMMPGMDGTTVLRALRAESSSLRLMATSGMPVTLPFHPLMNEEEVPFVLKPYDTPQLLHAVRSALLPEQSTPTLAP